MFEVFPSSGQATALRNHKGSHLPVTAAMVSSANVLACKQLGDSPTAYLVPALFRVIDLWVLKVLRYIHTSFSYFHHLGLANSCMHRPACASLGRTIILNRTK